MSMVYTFHTDPGHGWLEVPTSQLVDLGIEHNISTYSYVQNETAYLEEDCDAGVFVDAYKKKHGSQPEYAEKYSEHTFIRNLSPFRST
jgi:hypothetical protein